MLIYNVTIQLHHSIHELWLKWMQEKHMPEIMNTNCFAKCQLVKLLEIDETEGVTYAAQYYAADQEHYNNYIQNFATKFRNDSFELWGNQFIAFRSLMQVVN
jgi:hypothetical protein